MRGDAVSRFVIRADRHAFRVVIGQTMERFDASVLAYCLMDNHYHLVIQTRRGNLSRLMQRVNWIHTRTYNRRHGKLGQLFQCRFKVILVDQIAYLLEVCRYVDVNPLRARMVRDHGIHLAAKEGQLSLTTIARCAGLSVPRVSRIVSRIEDAAKDSA